MKDPYCVVEVGVHQTPYWKDKTRSDEFIVCNEHRYSYETSYDDYGPFDWEEFKP